MTKLMCHKCGQIFIEKYGRKIISEYQEYNFCDNCLLDAGTKLSRKSLLSPQEKELLFELTRVVKNPPWVN